MDIERLTFDEPDSESNLIQDATKETVKAASFAKLIEKATGPTGSSSPNMMVELLLTYRTICTPTALLRSIIKRLHTVRGESAEIVQLRCINLIRMWLEKNWPDFARDMDSLLPILTAFVQTTEKTFPKLAKPLATLSEKVEQKRTERKPVRSYTNVPPPIFPQASGAGLSLLDIDSLELARQITLHEEDLFYNIQPWELLDVAWTKESTKSSTSPNVVAMIRRFNEVSAWVRSEIVSEMSPKKRSKILAKLIDVLVHLDQLNNLNGVLEFVSALNSTAILRLETTIMGVSTRQIQQFETIKEYVSQKDNSKGLRERLKSPNQLCVPYLGLFLTDLLFIDEGHKDVTPEGLINFSKRRQIANTIRDIQRFQDQRYNLQPVPAIQAYLKSLRVYDDDTIYSLSNYLEPRPGSPPVGQKPRELMTPEELAEAGYSGAGEDLMEADFEIAYPPNYPFGKNVASDLKIQERGTEITIFGGTIVRLVEFLTSTGRVDPKDIKVFLNLYRSVISAQDLFDLLSIRFQVPPLRQGQSAEAQRSFEVQIAKKIRTRVATFLLNWLKDHSRDFEVNGIFRAEVSEFIEQAVTKFDRVWADELRKALTKVDVEIKSNLPPVRGPMVTKSPEQCVSLDFDPEEIARQLCLMHHSIFKEIDPEKFLKERALLFKPMQEDREQLEAFVTFDLETSSGITANLTPLLSRWCSVLSHLIELANWFAVAPISDALSGFFNNGTKDAWESIPLELRQRWGEIKKLLNEQHSAKLKIRMLQSLNAPPAIPSIDIVIDDVQTLLRTYPDPYLNIERTIIHFARWTALSDLLTKRVLLPQQVPYSFQQVPIIQKWIRQANPGNRISSSSSEVIPTYEAPAGMNDAHREDRTAILHLLQHDKQFRDEVKEMIRGVIRGQFEELRNEIVPAVDIREVASKHFPGSEVAVWKRFDDSGLVYGKPSEIQLNVVTKNSISYIIETKDVTAPTDIQNLIRAVTRSLNPKTQKMAERAKIEVFLAR